MKYLKTFEKYDDYLGVDDEDIPTRQFDEYAGQSKEELTKKLYDGIKDDYLGAYSVKKYIKNGANINYKDDEGSLLYYAVINANVNIVNILLEHGVKVDNNVFDILDNILNSEEVLEEYYEIKKLLEPYKKYK